LENYATVKQLPVDFLTALGLTTVYIRGSPAVKMPYFDNDGTEIGARFRTALAGENKFRWRSGTKAMPYGLWKIDRTAGYVILCEGESDAQTFWFHGIPALGIPGASNWKAEWARYLEGLTVFVWRECDQGGQLFAQSVGKSAPDCLVITPPPGRKDISDCHLAGDDVPELVRRLRSTARPWREIEAERTNEIAREAALQAAGLLRKPDILGEFVKVCQSQGLVGEDHTAKLLYLMMTSRLLEKPVSGVVKGPSSGGKSFTVDMVLKAFPPTAFYLRTAMSDRSLAYSDEPLKHRMLVIYEAAGMASDMVTYLIRSLLSEGRIVYEYVEKTADGLKPRLIEREGPTGLLVTTTWASLHPENETRLFSVTVRDDPKQTAGVLQALAARAQGRSPERPDFTPWHALQTWLELAGCRQVTIPYADELASLADTRAVRLRRDFGAVLNLIRAHAILHQVQRERDQNGRIIATLEDYRAVHEVIADVIGDAIQATVSATTRATVEAVAQLIEDAKRENKPTEVGKAQLAKALGLDKSAAGRRALRAINDGYLVNLETREKQPARYTVGDPMPADKPVLPDPDRLATGGGEGELIPPKSSAQVHKSESVDVGADTGGFQGQRANPEGLEAWQASILEEFDL
jgi:hypothetical protein